MTDLKWDCRLAGGLGNQIFQLAWCINMRNQYGGSILLRTHYLSGYRSVREFELSRIFDLDVLEVSVSESPLLSQSVRFGRIPFLGLNDRTPWPNHITIALSLSNICIDGYFQDCWSEDDFSCVIKALRGGITTLGQGSSCDLVIHLRGGDFLLEENLNICGFAWYERALRQVLESRQIAKVGVVTDDAQFFEKFSATLTSVFKGIEFENISTDLISDFELLLQHDCTIIGNSTFGFWGSHLGVDGRTIIAPSHFSRDRLRFSLKNSEKILNIDL
jgi:hypothetical protein